MEHRILIGVIASILLCAIVAYDAAHAASVHRNLAHRAPGKAPSSSDGDGGTSGLSEQIRSWLGWLQGGAARSASRRLDAVGEVSSAGMPARASAVNRSLAVVSLWEQLAGERLEFMENPRHSAEEPVVEPAENGKAAREQPSRLRAAVRAYGAAVREFAEADDLDDLTMRQRKSPPAAATEAAASPPAPASPDRRESGAERMMRAELHYRLESLSGSAHVYRDAVWRVTCRAASPAAGPRAGVYRAPDAVVSEAGVFLIGVRPVEGRVSGGLLDGEWTAGGEGTEETKVGNPAPDLRRAALSMGELLGIPPEAFHVGVVLPLTADVHIEAGEDALEAPRVDLLTSARLADWLARSDGAPLTDAQVGSACDFLGKAQVRS